MEAVKKIPFNPDMAAKASSKQKDKGTQETQDFKSVLEKSLNTPKDSAKPTALDSKPTKTTTSFTMPKSSPEKLPKNSMPISQEGAVSSSPLEQIAPKSTNTNTQNKLEALATKDSAPKPISQNTNAIPQGNALLSEAQPNTIKQKDLNSMAQAKPQETLLSKITQNKNATTLESNANVATPQKPAQAPKAQEKTSAKETLDSVPAQAPTHQKSGKVKEMGDDDVLQNILPSALPGAEAMENHSQKDLLPSATAQNAAKVPKEASLAQNNTKQTPATPENKIAPTLGDVQNKARELNLNPGNMRLEQENDEFKNSLANRAETNARTPLVSQDGIKNFFDKQDEQILRPFFYMLQTIDAKEAAQRRANKANKIEYVFEGKSEKVAVINRGKELPKNITQSRIKNDRQEKVFEQIQKDIIAGKTLDLEQIKANLLADEEQTQPLMPNNTPLSPASKSVPQGMPLSAALTSKVAPQEAQRQARETKEDRRDEIAKKTKISPSTQKEVEPAQNAKSSLHSNTQPQSFAQAAESSTQEELLDSMPFDKEEEVQNLAMPQSNKPKEAESKTEAKQETKLTSASSLGVNALKSESKATSNAKETISSFVSQFDQEVKKFKPPMNKISMELSPKELGNIELTITQRGKNLHVSVVSNPQALNLFAQNQVELRQNLIASGFEGVDLSFSPDSNNQGGFGENPQGNKDQNLDQNLIERYAQDSSEPTLMEITLPLYA